MDLKEAQNPNLIKQIPAERAVRPAGYYKSIALDVVVIAAAFATGYCFRGYLNGTNPISIVGFIALIFGLAKVFELLTMKDLPRRLFVLFLEIIALLVPFRDIPFMDLALIGVVAFLIFMWGEFSSHMRMNNSLVIRFLDTTKPVINKFLTTLVLVGVFVALQLHEPLQFFPGEGQFEKLYAQVTPYAKSFYPSVNFTAPLPELMKDIARTRLLDMPEFNSLSRAMQEVAITEAVNQLLSSTEVALGRPIISTEPPAHALRAFILMKLQEYQSRFGDSFLIAWGVVLFIAVRGILVLFQFVLAGIAFLVYEVLVAAKVLCIIGESRVKQNIEYA